MTVNFSNDVRDLSDDYSERQELILLKSRTHSWVLTQFERKGDY